MSGEFRDPYLGSPQWSLNSDNQINHCSLYEYPDDSIILKKLGSPIFQTPIWTCKTLFSNDDECDPTYGSDLEVSLKDNKFKTLEM